MPATRDRRLNILNLGQKLRSSQVIFLQAQGCPQPVATFPLGNVTRLDYEGLLTTRWGWQKSPPGTSGRELRQQKRTRTLKADKF